MILFFPPFRYRQRESVKARLNTTNELFVKKTRDEANDCEKNNISDNTIVSENAYHGINHGESNFY